MSWNDSNKFIPTMNRLHENIQKHPTAWMDQGLKLKCRVKYVNIRVDQRTGHFVLSGDTDFKISFPVYDADHFYANGWLSKDGVNSVLVSAVTEVNDMLGLKLRKEQLKIMSAIIEKHIESGVRTNNFRIESRKTLTLKDFEDNWK